MLHQSQPMSSYIPTEKKQASSSLASHSQALSLNCAQLLTGPHE